MTKTIAGNTNVKRLPLPKTWREVHPKRYIHTEDLTNADGSYKNFDLTVKQIEAHSIKDKVGKEQARLVAYFDKGNKPLILNVEMNEFLEKLSGSKDPADWKGLKVNLFVQKGVHSPDGRKDVPRLRARGEVVQPKGKLSKPVDERIEEEAVVGGGAGGQYPTTVVDLDELADDEFDALMDEADYTNGVEAEENNEISESDDLT